MRPIYSGSFTIVDANIPMAIGPHIVCQQIDLQAAAGNNAAGMAVGPNPQGTITINGELFNSVLSVNPPSGTILKPGDPHRMPVTAIDDVYAIGTLGDVIHYTVYG